MPEPGVNFIYALYDPRKPEEYRYIGKSNTPNKRMYHHNGKYLKTTYKANWIKSLEKEGIVPTMKILLKVGEDWGFWEARLIKFYREKGHRLTNHAQGGPGCPNPDSRTRTRMGLPKGFSHSPETRAKMRATRLQLLAEGKVSLPPKDCYNPGRTGQKNSPEHNRKISEGLTGRKLSPEHAANMRAAARRPEARKRKSEAMKRLIAEGKIGVVSPMKGKHHSEETKKLLSEQRKGKKLPKEHRQNISKGMVGRVVSEETKRKIGRANAARAQERKKTKEANQ